jgi:hypothetical protein
VAVGAHIGKRAYILPFPLHWRSGMTWSAMADNTWYYADAPATGRPKLETARRTGTFGEVTGGLNASTALFEARLCKGWLRYLRRRLPLRSDHQGPGTALGGTDAAAGNAGRDDPDEQLPVSRGPGLDARPADRLLPGPV